MKTFRQVALSALITIGAFGSVIYTGCKDKCGSTTCQNGGTCSENVCVCPTGYSGSSCSNTWTTEYIGTYQCTQTGSGSATWQSAVVVSVNNPGYTVTIENFGGNPSLSEDATIDSFNHITLVPPQPGYSGLASSEGLYTTPSNHPNGMITLTYEGVTTTGTPVPPYITMTMIKL